MDKISAYGRTHLLPVLSTGATLRDVISQSEARSYTHVAIDRDDARALRQLLQLGCDTCQRTAARTHAPDVRSVKAQLRLRTGVTGRQSLRRQRAGAQRGIQTSVGL